MRHAPLLLSAICYASRVPYSAFPRSPRIIRGRNLWIDRPDFHEQSVLQTRVTFGDLRRLIKIMGENEPVPANHFFRFTERAVGYRVLPPDRFTFIREPLPTFHFSLGNQLFKPGVELIDHILRFFP
jgi:hypothetical protein